MHCPGGNATDPILRVLASFLGISSWTPLKPQHSNPNPNPLANKLWCIDFLTPPTPLIIPHRLPAFLESLMPFKNWCSIHTRCSKTSWKHDAYVSVLFFPSLKHNFIAYRSSKVSWRPDCSFEIHQLWQSGFSRVYSNSCCSCSFESEIMKIGQSSHKMYKNDILNFQESMKILKACTKSLETYWMHHLYIYIYIYTHTHTPIIHFDQDILIIAVRLIQMISTLLRGEELTSSNHNFFFWDYFFDQWYPRTKTRIEVQGLVLSRFMPHQPL